MSTEVLERPEAATQIATQLTEGNARGGLSFVQYAIQSGAPVSEVRALVEMQIQMDNHKALMLRAHADLEREARAELAVKQFAEAMAAFKAEGIKVIRSKEIKDGPLKGKKHADLFAVVDAATEAMSKHGLSTTWRTVEDEKDWIKIACRVVHVGGHSEEVAFGGPIDAGPGRNAMQARKSSVSYLERITMLLALGLAEQDADDDGAGAAGSGGPETAVMHRLIAEAQATTTDKEALGYWKDNNKQLASWPYAFEKFKQAVADHRKALKTGGAA